MNLLHSNDRFGEHPESYYAATAIDIGAFDEVKGAHHADVCVVGGGYTGLSSALHLAQKGYNVILLEAHCVGFGASGRNGGQVGSGQRRDQLWLEKNVGRENAHRLWSIGESAKKLVQELIKQHKMPVTFHHGVAYVCRSVHEASLSHEYAEKLSRDYGYDKIYPLDKGNIGSLIGSKRYVGGYVDEGAGHIHPLNFALGLAKAARMAGVQIYEKSQVIAIKKGLKPEISTRNGKVSCDHLVLACNGYLRDLVPKVAARVMPINNFIIATELLGDVANDILSQPIAVADSDFVVNYWRLCDDGRLLFGGGESYGYRFPDIKNTVLKPMLKVYPQLSGVKVDYAWGGTLAITTNRMPNFMKLGSNVYSASGYSGHGVAMATMAGKLIGEAIEGQSEGFNLMSGVPGSRFPGGAALRSPLLALAMTWFSLRDKLGI